MTGSKRSRRYKTKTRLALVMTVALFALSTSSCAYVARVSVSSHTPNGGAYSAGPGSMSSTGRYVVFASDASNLVPGDNNGKSDVFVTDRDTDANGVFDEPGKTSIELISRTEAANVPSDGDSFRPRISSNGRWVVFDSNGEIIPGNNDGVFQVYVRDRTLGTTSEMSEDALGVVWPYDSFAADISDNGTYVSFLSYAPLTPHHHSNAQIFLRSRDLDADGIFDEPGQSTTVALSTDMSYVIGNDQSTQPVMSDDGRFVAFTSPATNLVAGDTNGKIDIFVHDNFTGAGTRLSLDSAGTQANGDSSTPALSANGRFVTFTSAATNLVAGDTNGVDDIFVRDRDTDADGIFDEAGAVATRRIDVSTSGTQANLRASDSAIDGNGRYVTYGSYATSLVSGDTNGLADVFLRDRDTDADGIFDEAGAVSTTRVDLGPASAQSVGGHSSVPGISGDGRHISFTSAANNLVDGDDDGQSDVFFRDRQTGTTTTTLFAPAVATGSRPSFSADGRWVAFDSFDDNLTPNDTNNTYDVMLRDLVTGVTTLVSRTASGASGDAWSFGPSISADGRYVAFDSVADNLVAGDTNNAEDVFVYDRIGGSTQRVSVGAGGAQSNGASSDASISANGRLVAFTSFATNLPNDTDSDTDIFVRDLDAGTTTRVGVPFGGSEPNGAALAPKISGDGRYIAFDSTSSNLVAGDTNASLDAFRFDRTTASVTLVSVDTGGGPANAPSDVAGISSDGRYILFESTATDLVASDTNATSDVFVRDATAGATTRASVGAGVVQGNGESIAGAMSDDGRFVAFASMASNLVAGDTNATPDVFVRDRTVGRTYRVSTNVQLAEVSAGTNLSSAVDISGDGRVVVFGSDASNLVADTLGGLDQLYFATSVRPTVTSVSPTSRARGFTGNVTVTGTGFLSGLMLGYFGNGVTVNSVTYVSDTQATANITVAANATVGARTPVVGNGGTGPGALAGAGDDCTNCFSVT